MKTNLRRSIEAAAEYGQINAFDGATNGRI
jgi:hypothetical protein